MKIKPEELIKYINCAAMAMNKDHTWEIYQEKPFKEDGYWQANGEYLAIYYTDMNFGFNIDYDGDWEDSLTLKRPDVKRNEAIETEVTDFRYMYMQKQIDMYDEIWKVTEFRLSHLQKQIDELKNPD